MNPMTRDALPTGYTYPTMPVTKMIKVMIVAPHSMAGMPGRFEGDDACRPGHSIVRLTDGMAYFIETACLRRT